MPRRRRSQERNHRRLERHRYLDCAVEALGCDDGGHHGVTPTLIHVGHADPPFSAAVAVYTAGIVLTLVAPDLGIRLAGLATVALALWLLRYDVARRTVRQTGVSRFIAVCILSGAVWLAVSGVLALALGDVRAGFHYDALLHTLFLGFVFALIFGHAPIMLPALTGLLLAFRSAFYAHLALLHGSVLMRLAADLDGSLPLRRWSGVVSAMALALFLLNTAWGVWSGRKRARRGWVPTDRSAHDGRTASSMPIR